MAGDFPRLSLRVLGCASHLILSGLYSLYSMYNPYNQTYKWGYYAHIYIYNWGYNPFISGMHPQVYQGSLSRHPCRSSPLCHLYRKCCGPQLCGGGCYHFFFIFFHHEIRGWLRNPAPVGNHWDSYETL